MNQYHKKYLPYVCEYLEEDLDAPFCQELRNYFEESPECKQYLESIKKTVELYRASQEEAKSIEALKQKLMEKIRKM